MEKEPRILAALGSLRGRSGDALEVVDLHLQLK
jgi:hypothetical protein